jgi:Domain of unknown function (DUF1833)
MRDISDVFKAAILQRETDEVAVLLLTIEHEDLATPLRLCSNPTPITSRGHEYVFFPFMITRPEEREAQAPQARLVIDAVDGQIVGVLRQIESAPTVTLEIVLASSPDIVEYQSAPMTWRGITYNATTVDGALEGPRIYYAKFPAEDFTPSTTPGVFYGGPNL